MEFIMNKRISLYLSLVILLLLSAFNFLPALADESNLITNESVETIETANKPTYWSQSKWGTNTATLQHKSPGHTGSRSLYVNVTSLTDGDAKWMHTAAPVQANTSYTYTSAYKSNVTTEIDLQYTDTAGKVTYAYVQLVPASGAWKTVTAEFTTPTNVAKVSVMHIVATAGWLETDTFALKKTNADSAPTPTDPGHGEPGHVHNLIDNNSFEAASGTDPAAWYKNSWGTNTAVFSHENNGRTGTRSAKVTMTSYTSGDAKWFAETSPVTAGKNYIYSDYYKATVPTRVVVAFVDSNNNYSYYEIASAPASADWAKYSDTFTVPANAVKASIYHVIDRVGSLTLDDVSLDAALQTPAPTTPVTSIAIPNNSVETAAGAAPASWNASKWGTNAATHQYINEGYTGTKSIKVTMANHVDGDAKWYFNPITSLKAGERYRLTAWYKTNTAPYAAAMFIMADGTEKYVAMTAAQPNGNPTQWQQYSDTFTVPAGAVSASAFLYIKQNGWLQTDDYSLTSYSPNGFTRPLLSMTFDDGHEDNAANALPILNQYGLKTTQCYATSFLEGKSQAVIDGALAFYRSGHEICSHTVNHPFLTTQNAADLTYELQHSKQYLEKLIGQSVPHFASPYGDYNVTVLAELKKHYQSHRSVDEGYNSKDNFNPYNLRVQNVLDTTSAAQVTAWIEQAKLDNTWLILVYHRVASNPGPYDSYTNVFNEHVKAISGSGITVRTYNDAFKEVTAQLQ